MKKHFSGVLATVLAISLCVFQSFTTLNTTAANNDDTFNWYLVGTDNKISNTSPVFTNKTKTQAISANACKDQVLPNCLYGTNGTVSLGQDISGEPIEQRIRRNN